MREGSIDREELSKSKEQIINALKQLLKEKRFSKITIGDICAKSELSRQSFYRNFYDKYDVFSRLFELRFKDAIDSYGLMAMNEIAGTGLSFFIEYKGAIKDMGCDFAHPNAFMHAWLDVCYNHYRQLIGKDRISPELQFAMHFYFCATFLAFYDYVCGNYDVSPQVIVEQIMRLLPNELREVLYNGSTNDMNN